MDKLDRQKDHTVILLCIILSAITLISFWDVQYNDFINFDDNEYITENDKIKNGFNLESIRWVFTTSDVSNWHPVTWLSHIFDYKLYGRNPQGHHFNSLILHLLNTLILFLFLKSMTGALWRSVLVSVLFSLHPLHVESVAWIAERKDLLSTFFFLISIWAYTLYIKKSGIKWLLISLLIFSIGLMSKPMIVTLPFLLILLDYWPLRRFEYSNFHTDKKMRKILTSVLEKLPYFLLSAISSIITYIVQKDSAAVVDKIPVKIRLLNAVVSYASYIKKMFWPIDLSVFYPHSVSAIPARVVIVSLIVLSVISFMVVLSAKRRPYLVTGWFWYLGTLIPVIGLVQVGSQAMADRYTYIPLIGLFIMISWGISDLSSRKRYIKFATPVFLSALTLILILLTRSQVSYWRNSISLFTHAIEVNYDSSLARNNLGNAFARQQKLKEAFLNFSEGLRIDPNNANLHNNLANVLLRQGKYEEAITHYREALMINPRLYKIEYNLKAALKKLNDSHD